jgi:arginyl-tRNA synthetase
MSVNIKNIIADKLSPILSVPHERIVNLIEKPPDPKFGDYAIPCFEFSRDLKKSPSDIALEFERLFSTKLGGDPVIQKVHPRGPYLNLFVDKGHFVGKIVHFLYNTDFSDLRYKGEGMTVVIDFSSPNIAKPFGIGHLRSTVIGNALKNIFTLLGYKVFGINHLGDWGTQFGKLICAYRRWGNENELLGDPIMYLYTLYVKFHSEAEKESSLEDEARSWFNKLEKGDAEARALWDKFRNLSIEEFKKIYKRLGVQFEYYTGESYYSDMLEETIDELKKSGITRESEGALIVPLEEGVPPALLKKSDEATLYLTRDIAAALYRHKVYNFDLALYVVGSPQALHFQQVFKVLEKMGKSWYKDCFHVPFGQIRFDDRSMSTRKGNVIFLEDVLDRAVDLASRIIEEKNPSLANREQVAEAVGVGAIIFNDLKNNRIKDVVFDWKEILNFNGETGPYLQYTYARIQSLLKKYCEKYGELKPEGDLDFNDEGYPLCLLINDFENVIERSSREFEPSDLARYLLDIASEFNSFYNSYRVITDNPNQSLSRALIVYGVNKILKKGLNLLGIEAVEEM